VFQFGDKFNAVKLAERITDDLPAANALRNEYMDVYAPNADTAANTDITGYGHVATLARRR
jgi:hypothetical protein